MEDFDIVYGVKIYKDNELIYTESFYDKESALKSSEFWEDKGYKCPTYVYQPVEKIERGEANEQANI